MEKIKRLVIPVRRYIDGTAPMNRLLGYAKGFAELGVDVWFYFLITNGKEDKPSIDNPKIHFVYLWENNNSFLRKYRGLGLFKNLLTLKRNINKDDVLFLYGRTNYMFAMARSVARRAKVFCEITEHPEYNGHGILKKLNVINSLHYIRKFDGLFVISQTLKEYFISKGVNNDKTCVVNMFVDSNRFADVSKKRDIKYIAYCGYVSIRKDGVDVLIRAFSKFHAVHPNYQLYIIGRAGFPEPISYFEDLAEKCGVNDSVVFTGEVSAKEMPQLLMDAEILALARPDSIQARNGFPTKLGEYLSTGNPIVVTNVGEIPLFIQDKVNGVIANESDVEDFADKLTWVADHPEQAISIGKNGKKLVENEFSYFEQSKKALSFINQIINQ